MVSDVAGVLIGTGIGCPGRVDFKEGRVIWLRSKLEFLEGVSLSRAAWRNAIVQRCCRQRCKYDSFRGRCGSVPAKGYQSAIGITVGTGIGGALISDGRMLRGKNWAAGHLWLHVE